MRRFCRILAKCDFFSKRIKSFWEHLQCLLVEKLSQVGCPLQHVSEYLCVCNTVPDPCYPCSIFHCCSCVPDIILVIVLTFSLLKPIFNFQVNTQQKWWPLLNTTLYKDQSMLTLCGLISKGIVSHLHVWSAQV